MADERKGGTLIGVKWDVHKKLKEFVAASLLEKREFKSFSEAIDYLLEQVKK